MGYRRLMIENPAQLSVQQNQLLVQSRQRVLRGEAEAQRVETLTLFKQKYFRFFLKRRHFCNGLLYHTKNR